MTVDAKTYQPDVVEAKWRARWAEKGTNQPDLDHPASPFFNLMMFPYPSAEGLHVGNMLRRLTGQAQRCTAGVLLGALVREPEIAFYLAALFFEQHREEEAWSKAPSCPTHNPGPARGSNGGDRVAVVFQQFVPNRYVSILDGS